MNPILEINNKKYQIIENLGFQHSCGMYAKSVMTNDGEKIVVKHFGQWKFWGIKNRLGLE